MIGKNTLKEYSFRAIEDYFNMIVDSIINGQRTQARDQIKKMNKEQKKDFLTWIGTQSYDYMMEAKQFTLDSI